jgi:tetratricopeptide (TPR) repeat protein
MLRPALTRILGVIIFFTLVSPLTKAAPSVPPQVENVAKLPEPPQPGASKEQLIERGDELRAEKVLPSALEYYRAALAKTPNRASVLNRIGIVEMELGQWGRSIREFELAIKADPQYPEAYNNLGVAYYETKKSGKAIAFYKKAIRLRNDEASFYSNLGAAYFARKDFANAVTAYSQALQLDPDVLEHSSRTGIAAQLPSPADRARFDFAMAKLYAKMGETDHSLEHLRRALEEGYKQINEVYKDEEFAGLRKDPRFAQLMAKRPSALPE